MNNNVTIVTGLWDLGRGEIDPSFKRSYDDYLQRFAQLLKTPSNMFIYVSAKDEDFIWQHRSRENTYVRIVELETFSTWFSHFDKVQEIRKQESWYKQSAWLEHSPQATLPYYNPIVMSKMFMLNDATIFNPFRSEYFYWIDAGICNTVHPGYFYKDDVFDNLPTYSDAVGGFTFLSYPYEESVEIHGFERGAMTRYANTDHVKYVCRGGFFGGKKESINRLNGLYYYSLTETIQAGYMGTEESIFTILSYLYPDLINRFELNGDGLVWPFFEALKDVKTLIAKKPKVVSYETAKTILYVLGFNSPNQFDEICKSFMHADPDLYNKPRKILINNSTNELMFKEYDELCERHGFEEIHRENLGVCGGRQYAAEHFDETTSDFYMFFEDDMMLNSRETQHTWCRSGFRMWVPNLYQSVHEIMLKEKFDFLKFSFSEFYLNNNIQVSWYNVPQDVRSRMWPEYDKLPQQGFDPNAPRTKFNTIEIHNNIPYASGEIYYGNWPQIVSREGNKKMFLETKWARPYEQTWMSYMFQKTLEGTLKPGILLASPVTHNRFEFYSKDLRKES
jgi:hypothetical protein